MRDIVHTDLRLNDLIFAFEAVIIGGLGTSGEPSRGLILGVARRWEVRSIRPTAFWRDISSSSHLGLSSSGHHRFEIRRLMSSEPPWALASVRRYSASSLTGVGVAGVVLFVLALVRSLADGSIVNRLTQLFSLLVLAVGWNLLAGYGGLVSIGQQLSSTQFLHRPLSLAARRARVWGAPLAIVIVGLVSVPISFWPFDSAVASSPWHVVIAEYACSSSRKSNRLWSCRCVVNDLNGYRIRHVSSHLLVGLTIVAATLIGRPCCCEADRNGAGLDP